MPELPEVHTTVEGLNRVLKSKTIADVWSSYNSSFHKGKPNIKNVHYFRDFRTSVAGAKFLQAERRGKNILIHLSNKHTVLIHMKMTGHLMYGQYKKTKSANGHEVWKTLEHGGPLEDPFNQHIRLVFILSNGKHVVFSDMRKFAKVFVFPTADRAKVPDIAELGPEPLDRAFTFAKFREQILKRPKWPIKQALLDQSIIAGIGNIYSDEMLWASSIHPQSCPKDVPEKFLRSLFKEMRLVLEKGIRFGGDSESDYRNIDGEPGNFQKKHHAYRHTGEPCAKRGCRGIIERIKVGGRSTHFCAVHQTLFK
jgi:formamidopyrimidine-DNA glycosylase